MKDISIIPKGLGINNVLQVLKFKWELVTLSTFIYANIKDYSSVGNEVGLELSTF